MTILAKSIDQASHWFGIDSPSYHKISLKLKASSANTRKEERFQNKCGIKILMKSTKNLHISTFKKKKKHSEYFAKIIIIVYFV